MAATEISLKNYLFTKTIPVKQDFGKQLGKFDKRKRTLNPSNNQIAYHEKKSDCSSHAFPRNKPC